MKAFVMQLLASPSFRRFLAMLITPLVVLLNAKFSLGVTPEAIAAVAANTLAYLAQSAWKETTVAKAASANGPAAPAPASP